MSFLAIFVIVLLVLIIIVSLISDGQRVKYSFDDSIKNEVYFSEDDIDLSEFDLSKEVILHEGKNKLYTIYFSRLFISISITVILFLLSPFKTPLIFLLFMIFLLISCFLLFRLTSSLYNPRPILKIDKKGVYSFILDSSISFDKVKSVEIDCPYIVTLRQSPFPNLKKLYFYSTGTGYAEDINSLNRARSSGFKMTIFPIELIGLTNKKLIGLIAHYYGKPIEQNDFS